MAYDWQQALTNALTHGAAGAGLGSYFGPIGAGVGALTGAGVGALSGYQPNNKAQMNQSNIIGQVPGSPEGNMFTGYSAYGQQFPRFAPFQAQGMQQLLQQGLQGLNFPAIEQQELRRFNTQTVPGLAERFTALGSGGSQRSSAFQGALGAAGSQLGENLAALRAQYALPQISAGLQPMFENIYIPGREGIAGPIAESTLNSIIPLLGQWLMNYYNQPLNKQQVRQQNIKQGYQPIAAPLKSVPMKPLAALPQLKS